MPEGSDLPGCTDKVAQNIGINVPIESGGRTIVTSITKPFRSELDLNLG